MSRSRVFALLVSGALGLQVLAAPAAGAGDKRGLKIATKIEKAWKGYGGEEFDVELQLVNARGDRVVRKMSGRMAEDGSSEKMLLTLNWPPDQKGIKLLTWGHVKQDDDQWLFLPSLKKARRISSRGRSGSFLGSEFAYEDLVSPWEAAKYTYKFLREQEVGKYETWVVERYPRDRHSGYSKQVVWFDQKYRSALRIDYYDRKGKLLKTATFKDYTKYKGKWRANRIEVVNRQTGRKSNLVFENRALGKSFSDELFSPEALEF